MKASTLFVVSIALLIGLGSMAGARYLGLFEKKTVVVDQKVKDEPILVLVSNTDLYKGVAITANDVRVRELHPGEKELYEQNRGNFMPPFVSAAHLRVPTDKIRADVPLLRKNFVEEQPEPLSRRLDPDMRGVTVRVPKERCAGGLIQLGEYVDVWLNTRINDAVNPNRSYTKNALLARECRIIAKRDNLRTVIQADDNTVSFTLEANPYRAALIAYAQGKGEISLVPNPSDKSRPLDPLPRESTMPRTWSDMTSKEYRDEDMRVEGVRKGELSIGDADLERIFSIYPPPPKIPPIRVLRINGISPSSEMIFGDPRASAGDTRSPAVVPVGSPLASGPSFGAPGAKDADCPTCGDNKAKAAAAAAASSIQPGGTASFTPPR